MITPYTLHNTHILNQCQNEIETLFAQSQVTNGKPLRVRMDYAKTKKSELQLGYCFGKVYPTIREYIHTFSDDRFSVQDIHEYHSELYRIKKADEISRVLNMGMGTVQTYRSMRDFDTTQMFNYVEYWRNHYAPLGLHIADPDRYWKLRGQG